jgi:hypothetical protein
MEPPFIGNTPEQHVDQVKYVVRLSGNPSGGITAVREGWVVIWGEMDVPLDHAARLSSAVAWDPNREVYEAFVAEQSYTQFEWGASGYGVAFLVDVVNSVSSELVVVGLTYAVTKMRGKKKREASWAASTETMDTLGVDATRAVEGVFREEYDDLTVEEATRVGEAVQVRIRGTHGHYIVTITALQTGDPVCHVTRADDAR